MCTNVWAVKDDRRRYTCPTPGSWFYLCYRPRERPDVLRPTPISSNNTQPRLTAAWWTFVVLAVALLPIMVLTSFDFGVTWDEKSRHRYGELVWEFLSGARARTSTYVEDGGHLYGGLFDAICAAVERHVAIDRYVLRHGINAIFGWIGVLYVGRLAVVAANGRACWLWS